MISFTSFLHLVRLRASSSTIWCRLHLLNRAFNMPLIGLQLCAIKPGWKLAQKRPRCSISPETQVSARYKRAAIHCGRSRSSSTFGWFTNGGNRNKTDTRIGKANAVLLELSCSVVTKREIQTPQSSPLLNQSLFRLSPMVMNLG